MMKLVSHNSNKKDWYRLKYYVHIGKQCAKTDRRQIEQFVKDKEKVAKHAFLPFIHKELKVRKFRREVCHDGTRSTLRKPSNKTRHIYYANHLDAKVFSYYSELLTNEYEKLLVEKHIAACVTASRKIKIDDTNIASKNKSTVHFANDLFEFIKSKEKKDLVAITFDIKSFFDNLDHKLLKAKWREVIKAGSDLPPDHYNVYRNITKFAFVEASDLFGMFQDEIIVKKPLKNNKRGPIKRIKIDRMQHFRNKGAVSYCDAKQIGEIRDRNLIKSNKYDYDETKKKIIGLRMKGIPQGSPISATLANIYMIDFDVATNNLVKSLGGVYQRYSDDMVVICPVEYEQKIIKHFASSIGQYKLEIQDDKTQVFHFLYNDEKNRHFCKEKNLNCNRLQNNTTFEYLGFQFDGYHVMIRNSSIANYYRKMRKRFKRHVFYTERIKNKTRGEIFKGQLYKLYTYKGAQRRRHFKKNQNNKVVVRKKNDWGNFITYANLSAEVMSDNKIKNQMKRFWNNFHKRMNEIEKQ